MKQTMALGDTRNQTWANDKSKFGYKMLQKMGWMEGKGLGVNGDGTTEHIRTRRKTTNVGVGGEAILDDWNKPAHVAAGLNDVLARLAPVNCSTAVVKTEKVTKKGRGYFQRRSAGKNVSGYSEKDLKEIFGGIDVDSKTDTGNGEAETDTTRQEVERGQGKDMLDYRELKPKKEEDIKQDTESLPGHDDRKKRKAFEKEERKKAKAKAKAKRKSLAVEVTIKKVKKSKKSKKRER